MGQSNDQLAHFKRAKRELALVTRIDEAKDIRDKAEALRVYAKQAGESLEMQNNCAEIKIRPLRRNWSQNKRIPTAFDLGRASSSRRRTFS